MKKTIFTFFLFLIAFGFSITPSLGGVLDDIKGQISKEITKDVLKGKKKKHSKKTIARGLKEALSVSTKKAVEKVSKKDGYFKDSKIRIPQPKKIKKIAKTLKKIGLGKEVKAFNQSMNRAAEAAAPLAVDIFLKAVKEMSFKETRKILKGSDTSATDYFRKKTLENLTREFRPVISEAMDSVGATKTFKKMMKSYNSVPFAGKAKAFDLDKYVTDKALEGLFFMVSIEEKKIRKDPKARVSKILKKVFGDL